MILENKRHPLVSVIITTYNGSQFIADTIASVLSQTYENLELVVVDDGSTDDTQNIVRSIPDPRIKLIEAGRIAKNGQVKNIGVSHCTGEFLAFLDHDDLWHEEKLSIQLDALLQNPIAGFCLTGGYTFRKRGIPETFFYNQREGNTGGNLLRLYFQSKLAVWTQALLVRKECLSVLGGFHGEKVFADPDFIVALISRFEGIIIFRPLLFRRLHPNNYSTTNWRQGQEEGISLLKHYSTHKNLQPGEVKHALFISYIHFGEKFLQEGKRLDAAKKFLFAWRYKLMSGIPLRKVCKTMFNAFVRGRKHNMKVND